MGTGQKAKFVVSGRESSETEAGLVLEIMSIINVVDMSYRVSSVFASEPSEAFPASFPLSVWALAEPSALPFPDLYYSTSYHVIIYLHHVNYTHDATESTL